MTIQFQRQRVPPDAMPTIVQFKWSRAVLREGFVPLPKMMLRVMHRLLDGPHAMKDLSAILAIVDYRRPQMSTPPSSDYLAFLAGLTSKQFHDALRRLEGAGYIKVSGSKEQMGISIDGLLRAIKEAADEGE